MNKAYSGDCGKENSWKNRETILSNFSVVGIDY